MKRNSLFRLGYGLLFLNLTPMAFARLGDASLIAANPTAGVLPLAAAGTVAPVWAATDDWPGVLRAARDLQGDIGRVTGHTPAFATGTPAVATDAVLIGTLGHSALIDGLVTAGKLDAGAIRNKWESFIIETVEHPLPGVERALVIAGSDKRGTIYGIYELSGQIGVSPWYWWADVPVVHRDALYVRPGRFVQGPPAVKYRGIFLNDEAPDLTNWVRAKFGAAPLSVNPPVPPGVANYNHEFYARIFEVLLRLRVNYLWPAMWNNAFNEDDPGNARLADEYGIVMGTSHQEPMLRAQKEWDRRFQATLGSWNYAKNPGVLREFWREGVRRNRNFESVFTLGLRGANDTEMAPGGPAANRALLENIVEAQRKILREEVNPDLAKVPQLWCLYKEVQDYYDAGMRAPDDVTLLWADDNWGNLRRLPTAAERARAGGAGGAGVYYHFDYHGGPRSYQWLNTSPLPKIWEQMSLADQYGADRIWIVNAGHFKGYELPTEFFLNLAWDPARWTADNLGEFTRLWAAREFGPEHAAETADIVEKYAKYNGRRKPELLSPATYSLVDYHEAENVVADYNDIAAKAEKIFQELPVTAKDAFYQLVLFPTKACALVNALYLAAARNALYARQGRASANDQAAEVRRLFQEYLTMIGEFDQVAGGKWAHFMDQPVLGYTTWRDPPTNNLDHLKLTELPVTVAASLGVAVEGSAAAWPGSAGEAALPEFDALNQQRHSLDVFNRGKAPFEFSAATDRPWIKISETHGRIGPDRRLWVSVDWTKAPPGQAGGTVKLTGAGGEVTVLVRARRPVGVTRASLQGFAEGDGVVSIEPEHYTRRTEAGANRWIKVADYGRTLSGMRAEAPADAAAAAPGKDAPCLEYRIFLFTAGTVEVTAIAAPTLNFIPNRAVRYAVAFDDEAPQMVTLVPRGYKAQNGNRAWEQSVADNAHYARSTHTLARPGYHTLKIWMVDPGVVLQKLVVNLGGLRHSYLGPPESFRGPESMPANFFSQEPAAVEQRRRLGELAAEDRQRMLARLGLTEPAQLPPPAVDPKRPAKTALLPGSRYNWSDGISGHTIVRSSWGRWSNYDPAKADVGPLPDPLVLKNGRAVTDADTWWRQRRPEILRDFETEIYGRIPAETPRIVWEAVDTDTHALGGLAKMRHIVGHIDNAKFPAATPRIDLTLYTPVNAAGPVPVLVVLTFPDFGGPAQARHPTPCEQMLARGWGYAAFTPTTVQADSGAGLNRGIIGLVNAGRPRKPDDWGALAAWSWGLSRAIDYLEGDRDVDAKRLGLAGHSRYGKAALVAAAYDPRWAIVFASCSGEGGAKLHRHDIGESLDNVCGAGEYHWMAGNILKYAGRWDALPVDQHELIALIAPRPVFVTGGTMDLWSDPVGEFKACVGAGPVYRLLGGKDLGQTAMPAADVGLVSGDIAYRLHAGGHADLPDWSTFLQFAGRYFGPAGPGQP